MDCIIRIVQQIEYERVWSDCDFDLADVVRMVENNPDYYLGGEHVVKVKIVASGARKLPSLSCPLD